MVTLKRFANPNVIAQVSKNRGRPRGNQTRRKDRLAHTTTGVLRAAAAAADDGNSESSRRLDRYQRAELLAFGLQFVARDERLEAVLVVTELVLYHGQRQGRILATHPERTEAGLEIASGIVEHLETLGLTAPAKRDLYTVLLAVEILQALPWRWSINGRQILEFFERDLSGAELVRMVRGTDEV